MRGKDTVPLRHRPQSRYDLFHASRKTLLNNQAEGAMNKLVPLYAQCLGDNDCYLAQ